MRRELPALGFLATAGAAALLACAPRVPGGDGGPRPHPTAAEEPEPEVFGRKELRADMWRLGEDAERINVIMRRSSLPLTGTEQAEILARLDDMESIATRLSSDEVRGLHPMIGRNIDTFRKDVALARKTASLDPPNFFMAGTIAGACGYCHGNGFGQVDVRQTE